MGENMFAKFNEMFNLDDLKKDVESASSSTGDFVEVPHGDYEVSIVKLEIGKTGDQSKTPGAPMAKVWFNILDGEYKNQKIFMNQMLTSGFGIHKMNEFLDSLGTGISVGFENFEQYNDLFAQIFGEIDGRAEYQLSYTANRKNERFSEYEIVKRFV